MNVAKELAKITKGRVRDRDVTWFTELVDKRVCSILCTCSYIVCSHRKDYWAMKNCDGCPDTLCELPIVHISNL